MKIIKRNEWGKELTCGGCQSTLLAETNDVRHGNFGAGYGGDNDYRYYVDCPVCGTHLKFPEGTTLPPHVDAAARRPEREGIPR